MTTTLISASAARVVTLRPVVAADADAMQAFVAELGPASRRWRFHGTVNGCTPTLLRHLTQVDGRRHVAFVACAGQEIVGEARYFVRPDGAEAEFAIAVGDAFQGQGVASALLGALVDAASAAGISRLYGDVIDGNERMAAFMRREGFEVDASLWDAAEAGVVRWQRAVRRNARVKFAGWRIPTLPSLPEMLGRFAMRAAGI